MTYLSHHSALIRKNISGTLRGMLSALACVALVAGGADGALAQAGEPSHSTTTTPLAQTEAEAFYANYRLRNGETIENLRIHYATLGSPHRNTNGEIDNAVMVLHWTGNSGASLLTLEYKNSLFADGKPLDARRYFLIFPDNLGHGQSSKPSNALRAHFPHYGYNDLVDIQHKLVTETLGVKRLHAILGVSMGGMNAWQWAEAYPDQVNAIMPVVSLPVTVSGRNLLWRRMAIAAVRSDPEWKNGDYSKQPHGLVQGYQLLRMMIDGVPRLQATIQNTNGADSYLAALQKEAATLDANDFLYSLDSSQDYDPEAALSQVKAKVYALNFLDDEFNPDELQILQTTMKLVRNGRYSVQNGSRDTYGHLTMAHPALWADHVGEFMNWANSNGQ